MAGTKRTVSGIVAGALLVLLLVRWLEGPVDHLGDALSRGLRGDAPVWLEATPAGLPAWVLALDTLFGLALLCGAFFGGVPLAVCARVLDTAAGDWSRRLVEAHPNWWGGALTWQVAGLVLSTTVTLIGLITTGAAYLTSPWAWYQLVSIAAAMVAIPAWRRVNAQSTKRALAMRLV